MATAVRTIVVLIFSWLMVRVTGTLSGIKDISGHTLLFLVLSGLATGASWLCYFHALQKGDINKVVPIDKSSTILTILLALIFLHEGLSWAKAGCVCLIGVGTMMMITRKEVSTDNSGKDGSWLIYAVLSAVFASLTAILGKIGISGVDSNLGTAIRTTVVLVMAWLMVFMKGKQHEVRQIEKKELLFIGLSGIATGASWLCYYRALQEGPASVVVPIDKLSILVTIAFSWIVFHEKLTRKSAVGQTVWNVANKICGETDIELTEKGHQQAIETGQEILRQGIHADEILYSPLMRAADTAKHISEIVGIPARVEPRLIEQNFGKYESTPRNGEEFQKAKQQFVTRYDGGESMLHLAQRIYNLLDEIREESDHKTYILVAHNGISRVIQSYFYEMTNEEYATFGVKNCEVRRFDFE